MIARETDPTFINRIANSDGVRPFIRPDGGAMDWTPIAAMPPHQSGVIILSDGDDAIGIFEATTPFIFQAHTLFGESCRGRRAIETAKAMLAWIFDHGATIVWGCTPRKNRKAVWFNRLLGMTVSPVSDEESVIFEMRREPFRGGSLH